ncbi:MAG TPA: 7-cyano-7-deazaguanine synthase QueC [Burkholderiaceae bacterium]|nr:7-cyano-7-deazaguanine synthase QueC [Burkholderiaceae bacterium]
MGRARPGRGATLSPRHALVLFSGGQDSTTCLAWALAEAGRFDRVETVAFDYGQRHRIELDCRLDVLAGLRTRFPAWGARLGDDHLIDMALLKSLGESALTSERVIEMQANGLPSTFVPARNLLFLGAAAALAYRRGAAVLVGGMCQTDYSGYPDCRDATLRALEQALRLGLDAPIEIATPLMFIDKAATWALARTLGGDALVELIAERTHTCYLGERGARHAWGYGCGGCPACDLRRRGFARWRATP